ncbi:hypothetical protein BDW02DRAFT_569485 [Decorospora gaudefroyi]|uniref:Cytochrome P450 n=1 Tax=Decorospora gaudefroyi TaxID=184978 RepID=A0A6A5KKG4_9PLEO|nr:hypothetical protein BDW02DRAFT_569485 [Decorospora gaudefroyi]
MRPSWASLNDLTAHAGLCSLSSDYFYDLSLEAREQPDDREQSRVHRIKSEPFDHPPPKAFSPDYSVNLSMPSHTEELNKARNCAQIIQFAPNGKKYSNTQQARVEPNKRLKDVFGIDNVFTNETSVRKMEFLKEVECLMLNAMKMTDHTKDGNWGNLSHQAIAFLDDYMKRADTGSLDLAELTQYIVLKQSLCYLFEGTDEVLKKSDTQFEDITYIGRRINELWIETKKAGTNLPKEHQLVWSNEKALHNALRRVTFTMPNPSSSVPGGFISNDMGIPSRDPEIPRQNPLNLLLPAYETMWRVVMRCFLEVQHRNAQKSPDWLAVLRQYLEDLSDPECKPNEAFHKSSDATGKVCPAEIVKEALRLYPPTRRVHRMFNGEAVAANIEECQRFSILAGKDPLSFRPERWREICSEERQAFYDAAAGTSWIDYKRLKDSLKREEEALGHMPFAYYCAADHPKTKEFASKMIALLVAVLCHGLGNNWELEDPTILPPTGMPLGSDRGEYEKLMLKRRIS